MKKVKLSLEGIIKEKEKFAPKKRLVFVNVPANYYLNLLNMIHSHDYEDFMMYSSEDMFREVNT